MSTIQRVVMAAVLIPVALAAGTTSAGPPNIVLMLSDDQGWDGLSVAMAPDIAGSASRIHRTPRLERFAAEGMRFTDGYAPGPVCSPSRISIQCGRTPAALHWTKAAPAETGHALVEPRLVKSISADHVTVGEMLRAAGYATAHYGKWHIGGGGPGEHGYDEHDGDIGNEQAFKFTDPNPVDLFGMAERAATFMERARDAGRPFYVQLSWNALHAAGNARAATKAKPKPKPVKRAAKPQPKKKRAKAKVKRTPPMHQTVSHPELDDEAHEEVFEIFKAYDRDGSGSIDRGEFARLLEALGQNRYRVCDRGHHCRLVDGLWRAQELVHQAELRHRALDRLGDSQP